MELYYLNKLQNPSCAIKYNLDELRIKVMPIQKPKPQFRRILTRSLFQKTLLYIFPYIAEHLSWKEVFKLRYLESLLYPN